MQTVISIDFEGRENPGCHLLGHYLVSKGIRATTGIGTVGKCANVHYDEFGINLYGGPEFCAKVEKCGEDIDLLKDLAFRTTIQHTTPEGLMAALFKMKEFAYAQGRRDKLDDILGVLGIDV